jgi:hypothetical protein
MEQKGLLDAGLFVYASLMNTPDDTNMIARII